MQIRPGTPWLYLGNDAGFDLVHLIMEVDVKNPKRPRIITYSLAEQDGEDDPGYTWSGTLYRFLKVFVPLGPIDESAIPQ